ncbi:MAG: hypothetical protein REJ24_13220 [Rhodocyclaceae bacterium]|nr:hypothetical protein [Pseudomonadota bacterium]MDQ7973523.1 hypothetical protein [Rhodocyclaceae bacterium]MDQ7998429.1 hypothetical protein [Pseudomonadota bacterium]MDQ8016290.1 hypothetical protein [Pseudomonadota bacterium]
MPTDRNFQLFLTRLSADDLACIAGLHQGSGDEAAERVAQGLRIAAECRRQAELRQARAHARRAVWVGMRRQWRHWCHVAKRPVGPWAHGVGGRLRQRLSSFGPLT